MKQIQKWCIRCLILALIPALLSTCVLAFTQTPVSKIEITGVKAPSAGSTPDFNSATCKTAGCELGGAGTLIHWYSSPDNSSWSDMNSHGGGDESFRVGYYYKSVFFIELSSGDYCFADSVSATVNGKSASAKKVTSGTVPYVEVTMKWGQLMKGSVSEIAVTVQNPVPGTTPDPTQWSVPDGAKYMCYSLCNDIMWYHSADGVEWEPMIDDSNNILTNFGYGEYFKAATLMIAENGYKFSSSPTVTINGMPATIVSSGYDKEAALVNYASYWLSVEAVFEPVALTPIDEVSVTVAEPVFGGVADYNTCTVNSEQVVAAGADTYVRWYRSMDGSSWEDMSLYTTDDNGNSFECDYRFAPGWKYQAVVALGAADGYCFSDSCRLTINGVDAQIEASGTLDGMPVISISRVWELQPERIVDCIEISGVAEPVVGGVSDGVTYTIPGNAGYTPMYLPNPLNWYVFADGSWERLEHGSTFFSGTGVKLQSLVLADDNAMFAEGLRCRVNDMEGTVLSVRYEDEEEGRPAGWYATIEVDYGTLSGEMIESVKISGISEPEIGEKPDFGCKVPKNSGYGIQQSEGGVIWEVSKNGKSWDTMEENDKFKEGYCYRVRVMVLADTGFELSPECTAAVNNQKAEAETVVQGAAIAVTYEFDKLEAEDEEPKSPKPAAGSGSRTIVATAVSVAGGMGIIGGALWLGKLRKRRRHPDFKLPEDNIKE